VRGRSQHSNPPTHTDSCLTPSHGPPTAHAIPVRAWPVTHPESPQDGSQGPSSGPDTTSNLPSGAGQAWDQDRARPAGEGREEPQSLCLARMIPHGPDPFRRGRWRGVTILASVLSRGFQSLPLFSRLCATRGIGFDFFLRQSLKLASKTKSSCLSLLSAGITGMHHCTWQVAFSLLVLRVWVSCAVWIPAPWN
jgi:hypothetical protein